MKSNLRRILATSFILSTCLAPNLSLLAAPQFSITNLNQLLPTRGFPGGFEMGDAVGISQSGSVVGSG